MKCWFCWNAHKDVGSSESLTCTKVCGLSLRRVDRFRDEPNLDPYFVRAWALQHCWEVCERGQRVGQQGRFVGIFTLRHWTHSVFGNVRTERYLRAARCKKSIHNVFIFGQELKSHWIELTATENGHPKLYRFVHVTIHGRVSGLGLNEQKRIVEL